MVKFSTSRFGEIEIKSDDTLVMPEGLIGFPEMKRYVLLDHGKDSPFKWLQSLDDGAIAFVLMNPLLFKPDYAVEVTESDVKELDLASEDDAVISVIVTMPSDPEKMTANLKAPLVFNLKNRRGMQVILGQGAYTTRHSILEEVKSYEKLKNEQEQRESRLEVKVDNPEQKAPADQQAAAENA